MRTTLAQLLARRGALSPALALELVDRLAVRLGSGPCEVGRLLHLSPAAVDLELVGQRLAPDSVQILPGPAGATTEPYMAWPELGLALTAPSGADPARAGGEPAAVYCLGVLLYHMLWGRAPFSAGELDDLATMHLKEVAPRQASRAVSPALEDLLWRALAKRREARFPSLAGLREAVAGARSTPPPPSPPPSAPAPEADRQASPPEAVARYSLYSPEADRHITLGGLDGPGPDGSREIRVGRGEPRKGHAPPVDLGDEPFGWRVRPRQAILRYGPAGWTIEEWNDPDSVGPREGQAQATRVNGVALTPGERRPISVGDAIAFGPVRMRFVLFDPEPPAPPAPPSPPAPPNPPAPPASEVPARPALEPAGERGPRDEPEQAPAYGWGRPRLRAIEVPPPGVVGHFRLGEALGATAPGPSLLPAYRATDLRTQAPAVVHLLPLLERTEPAVLRAIDEGLRGARELDACSGIARLLAWEIADAGGKVAQPPYLARELVDGRSIRALLRAQGRVQPDHALEIGEHVAEVLAFLARNGRVHGAIHPDNVFVSPDGGVKVTDWAVAYVRRAASGGSRPSVDPVASPGYHAPEEYQGQEPDTRSDLFCLGLLLYELIAGAPPYPPPAAGEAGGGPDGWRRTIRKDRPALPGAPEAVERIVFKALAADPLDRYAEPQAMLADIDHYLRPAVRRAVLYAASGTTFPVDRSHVVLGRLHPGSLPYPDVNLAGEPGGDTVSRQHARIYYQEGRWWVVQFRDVVNWTYVQGRLLHTGEPAPLQDGDRLDVGQVTLTFRTGGARRADRPR